MTWLNPIPLDLILTSDPESFKTMPKGVSGLPVDTHPGAFGVQRKHHNHEGVDLYVPAGTKVTAVEAGVVVAVYPFTGPIAGSPWWHATDAVLIAGQSGVVVYGEIDPCVRVGDIVPPGGLVGFVERVLTKNKGRPMSMLHLELHAPGTTFAPAWEDGVRPLSLLDPTPYLKELVK